MTIVSVIYLAITVFDILAGVLFGKTLDILKEDDAEWYVFWSLIPIANILFMVFAVCMMIGGIIRRNNK